MWWTKEESKMPSMDIVSEVDEEELRNAVENSRRDVAGLPGVAA